MTLALGIFYDLMRVMIKTRPNTRSSSTWSVMYFVKNRCFLLFAFLFGIVDIVVQATALLALHCLAHD